MSFNLRKRARVSYYEPDEPNFDDYLYCDQCCDFVYDYCAIHGPLLVIPDNKVPIKTGFPSYVPRAALTIPDVFLHIAPSIIPGAGLGVFSTLTLPRGVRFGPYCGHRTQHVDSMYCWQIKERNNKSVHVIDAKDSDHSNWMRYVNCSRHWKEQNLLAYQYKGQLYYRTIKIIPRFTELMVFYGSEFANILHINLSKYNAAKYYAEIIRPLSKTRDEIIDAAIQNEDFTADQFHFIDETQNNQSTINTEENNITQKENIEEYSKLGETETHSKNMNVLEHLTEVKESSNKNKYKCDTCQKTFTRAKTLKVHVLRHLNIWKYHCDHCPYKGNCSYRFKQHVGQHTNTYKYVCEKCNFKTNYKRTFDNHCVRNINHFKIIEKWCEQVLKVYICDTCNYKNGRRTGFVRHISTHSSNNRKCNLCDYSNHSTYNLKRHIKNHH